MLWRRPMLRWAVIFVAPGLAWWLFVSPARNPSLLTRPVDLPAASVAASGTDVVAADHVAVISIDEYSGHLLAAALPPIAAPSAPIVSDGAVFLSGMGPAPAPTDRLLAIRSLRTQFSPYRTWVLPAAAPPLALGLTEPLHDVRDVWRGEEALGPLDIVQNDNRLLRGDITITAVAADGTATIDYGGSAYTLAPGTAWRFAAVRPPGGDSDDIATFEETLTHAPSGLTALDDWLAEHLAAGYADTVLTVTNHGLIARAHIYTGSVYEAADWPHGPPPQDASDRPVRFDVRSPDTMSGWWQP